MGGKGWILGRVVVGIVEYAEEDMSIPRTKTLAWSKEKTLEMKLKT